VGSAPAQGVVVTNLLPSGLAVDTAHTQTSAGAVAVQGNTVTAQVGDLAPNTKVTVEIPVSVGTEVGNNISTQASAQYQGAADPVQSNAYIAQVAEASGAPTGSGPSSPPKTEPQAKPQEAPKEQPQQPQSKPQEKPAQPQSKPANTGQESKPANTPTKQNAPMPQTGGSFPIFLAVVLVAVTLIARYLRVRKPRGT